MIGMPPTCKECGIYQNKDCGKTPVRKTPYFVVREFAKHFREGKEGLSESAQYKSDVAVERLLENSVCPYVRKYNGNDMRLAQIVKNSDEISGYVQCYKSDVKGYNQKTLFNSLIVGVAGAVVGVATGLSVIGPTLDFTLNFKELAVWIGGGIAAFEGILMAASLMDIVPRAKILANDIRMFLGNAVDKLRPWEN
ncbi:MAG: hypothetical protein NT051_01615 [Candidatus Micrarchaeota archaeon]|nr:hypothetical protein [Candidatus Micrarchaeota archaeon]